MTTIIVDKQERKVYADTRATYTKVIKRLFRKDLQVYDYHRDNFCKFFTSPKGNHFVGAGVVSQIEHFVSKDGCSEGAKVLKDASVVDLRDFTCYGDLITVWPRYLCLGSGRDTAARRVYVGVHPEDAIVQASHEDKYTSPQVRIFNF